MSRLFHRQRAAPLIVRVRCACGRRYRVRNAAPNVSVKCAGCGRSITISEADIRDALAGQQAQSVPEPEAALREAIPVDYGELTLAPQGSRPGLTGEKFFDNEEALMANAMRGWAPVRFGDEPDDPGPTGGLFASGRPVERTFFGDLLASFYFAGLGRNALNILLTAAALSFCAAFVIVRHVAVGWLAVLAFSFLLCFFLVAVAYITQFFWSVLRVTAEGEDEIPWVQQDWELWRDGVRPLWWMLLISLACTVPMLVAAFALPANVADRELVLGFVLLAGWFFWPVAVMSVALGDSPAYLRPDRLIRCLAAVGLAYVPAWLAVVATLGAGYAALTAVDEASAASVATIILLPFTMLLVTLYFGYVLFRTLGLLYRHFKDRFPWHI